MVNYYKLKQKYLERQSYNDFNSKFGTGEEDPKGILELEVLAEDYFRKRRRSPEPDISREAMMSIVRQQYNLNFVLLCERCHGPHSFKYDELEAPDR